MWLFPIFLQNNEGYIIGLLPAEFSDGSDLKATAPPEPTYASPGTWQLGDLAKDEIITLTYKAKIGDQSDPGVYPDMVWATGTSEQSVVTEGQLAIYSPCRPQLYRRNRWRQLWRQPRSLWRWQLCWHTSGSSRWSDTSQRVSSQSNWRKQGSVLGASTELPATGAHAWLTIILLPAQWLAQRSTPFEKRLKRPGSLVGVMVSSWVACYWPNQRRQPLLVRIEAPYNTSSIYINDASTGQTDMKVDFVAPQYWRHSITAQCQQQKDNGSWSNITTVFTPKAGGNFWIPEAKDPKMVILWLQSDD